MAEKTEVELGSIEDFKDAVAAQARIAVFQGVITALLQAQSEYETVDELCEDLTQALLKNAEQDMLLISKLTGKKL